MGPMSQPRAVSQKRRAAPPAAWKEGEAVPRSGKGRGGEKGRISGGADYLKKKKKTLLTLTVPAIVNTASSSIEPLTLTIINHFSKLSLCITALSQVHQFVNADTRPVLHAFAR